MRKIKKNLAVNLILLICVIFIMLIFTEIILRVFFPIPSYPHAPHTFEIEQDIGYKLAPNINTEIVQPEFKINFSTNSFGFRDADYTLDEINTKELVILSLGDSFTAGHGVEESQMFNSVIEKKFKENGSDVEVINSGVPGYGIIQQRKTAEKYVPLFNPDIVILNYFVGNDMREDYNFVINNKWFIVDGHLTRSPNENKKIKLEPYIIKYLERIMQGNSLAIKSYRLLFGKKPFPTNYEQFKKSYTTDMEENWIRTSGELERLNNYLKDRNIKFIIVLIPSRIQVSLDIQKSVPLGHDLDLDEVDFYKINKLLRNFTAENDILFIDLIESMGVNGIEYYYKLDPHWNSKGHNLCGDITYNNIKGIENVKK